jgi:proline iminopeptidase
MTQRPPVGEGRLSVDGGEIWYRVVGDGPGAPLVTLHGGPGFPSDYLEPLTALADERPIVFYDQLGCGRSDRPADPSLWRVERFVGELAALIEALGLDRPHLLGHSWGAMLAVEFALARPDAARGLALISPPISIPRWVADLTAYRKKLPRDVAEALDRHEAAGTTDSAEYLQATQRFYQHHLCRLYPWPAALRRSLAAAGDEVYRTLWGPNEFTVTGALRDYDRTGRLGEIRVPTLFAGGAWDEATPGATEWYQRLLPGSERVVFRRSAHVPMLEETERFVEEVRGFLARAELGPRDTGDSKTPGA